MEQREKYFRNFTLVLIVFLFIWALVQFLAPITIQKNSIQNLSGQVVIYNNEILIEKIDFPWNNIYYAGDILCHQKEERSYFINGNQLPFCSRCTAIWLGFPIGVAFVFLYKLKLSEKFLLLLFIGITPMAIDGIGQLINLWESTNLLRVITGLVVGIICGLSIGVIINETNEIMKNNKKSNN